MLRLTGMSLEITLTAAPRREWAALVARRTARAGHVRRARIILLSADGASGADVAMRVGISVEQVSRIRRRFIEGGVEGLADQPKAGRKDHAVPAEVIEKIVQTTMGPPPAGRTRWTTRLLGREFNLASRTISTILRANGLKPHLMRPYRGSGDPELRAKVRDVVGLYLNPPDKAVVLSVDEKTQIQALERTQLPLPLRQGRAARHTHDYKRHGVVDLYAALNIATGEVAHACTDRHTAAAFLGFITKGGSRHATTHLNVN